MQDSLNEPTPLEDIQALISEVAEESRSMLEKQDALLALLNNAASQLANLGAAIKAAWQESQVDNLTSLHNRKSFERALSDFVRDTKIGSGVLSVIVMDIDSLNDINTRFGVLVGDHVLKLFAKLLKDNCKGQDFPARYAGDRFTLILPDTNLENAIELAEQIRKRIARQELVNRTSKKTFGSITISCGVSSLRADDEPRQLVERAERTLAEAKKGGRNKVCSE
jgi:diguanylate cyclase